MSYSDAERQTYYPEEYDYSFYYQNEFANYAEPTYTTSIRDHPHGYRIKKSGPLPTINYLNERRCPIYVHNIKNDSSVFNNYNENLSTPRKTSRSPRVNPQTSSKFVLDKLEETYWATWKPKKENVPVRQKISPRKVFNLEHSDIRPAFRIHNKGSKKTSNTYGDVTNKIIKYFKSNHFESSTTSASINPEDSIKKKSLHLREPKEDERIQSKKIGKVSEKDSVSQEIQTVVHCPVILEQDNQDKTNFNTIQSILEKTEIIQPNKENGAETDKETKGDNKTDNQPKEKRNKFDKKDRKKNDENKTKPKPIKKAKKVEKKSTENLVSHETEENVEFPTTFIEHKDSIEIAKEKQERSGKKEHYQQPKCIRLYRKSGITTGIIKGGTYPLKSCLKKDGLLKGNFRLGAPGSPLFVTSNSFSNKRR